MSLLPTEFHGDTTQSLSESHESKKVMSNQSNRLVSSCASYLTHERQNPNANWPNWQNGWDGRHYIDCNNGKAIVGFKSVHNGYHEDRRWSIACRPLVGAGVSLTNCEWTSSWTGWDGAWTQPSGHGGDRILTGIQSNHHGHYEDRQFKFRHCKVQGVTVVSIHRDTTWQNHMDQELKDAIETNQFYNQMTSHHSNHAQDRQFKFTRVKLCLIPVDCVMSQWTDWGECVGEKQTRTRSKTRDPLNGGTVCGALSQQQACTQQTTTTTTKKPKEKKKKVKLVIGHSESSANCPGIPSLPLVLMFLKGRYI